MDDFQQELPTRWQNLVHTRNLCSMYSAVVKYVAQENQHLLNNVKLSSVNLQKCLSW